MILGKGEFGTDCFFHRKNLGCFFVSKGNFSLRRFPGNVLVGEMEYFGSTPPPRMQSSPPGLLHF